MEWSWIVLGTVLQLQAIMLTTLAATSVNQAETTNNYHQVKASGRALDLRNGQLQVQAQVSTDRTFTGTRQLKPQKKADFRRQPSTVNVSIQRRQQYHQQHHQHQQQLQQQQQQQQYGVALSHSDWTPIVQPKERLQKDYNYQQQQVRQPDAIFTFVTPPPPHYNEELGSKNQVQHLDDAIDNFRNYYPYLNASESSEGYDNKLRNVTSTTNVYGAVDESRKNSNFSLNDRVLEKNKTGSQNNYNNRVNAAKEQNKHYPQLVYNTDGGESAEENNRRPSQSYDFDSQLNPRQNAQHVVGNTDVLPQLGNENNKRNGQMTGDQRAQIRYRENQNFHLLDGESKSDVLRDRPNNSTAEVHDSNIVYNTNAVDVANEQRENYNEGVDDDGNDYFNYNPLQYANGVVDGRVNSTDDHDALVGTDSKPEDGRKFVNLKFGRDESKDKQRVSSEQYVNMNLTAGAAGLEPDSAVIYERPRGHNDHRRGEIEHRRPQKPSVVGGAEVNPTVPTTTTSARQLRRKVQSTAKSRRPAAEDDRESDDATGSRTLYDGQNGYERKQYNGNYRGRITTPSDGQLSVMTTARAPVIDQDVIDGDDDYIVAEEELEQAEPGGYGFGYTVLDENVGMDFGQWERREPGRTGTVTGQYRVRLPDGRTQTVRYYVSPATGYRASVTYEGVQRHPSAAQPPRLVEHVDSAGAETRSPN